jgi:hypothetical protein
MKKFLMMSMVFAVVCTAFTGCSKKDAYDPDRPEQDAHDVYRKNFKAFVEGTIDSRVDWGFGATAKTRAMTRADKATGVWDTQGYATYFYTEFFETVQEYFPEGAVCKSSEWTNFEFKQNAVYCNLQLIYSNTSANDEIGLYYYDPKTEKSSRENRTVKLIENLQDNSGDLNYYLQFNRHEEGGLWNGVSTTSGYALWKGNSPAKRIQCRTCVIEMDKDYQFGFYVKNKDTGKTYYTNQYLNDDEQAYSAALIGDKDVGQVVQNYVFGLSDDGKPGCNLLFVMPKKSDDGTYPTLVRPEKKLEWWRIIAEDLNAHDLDKDGEVDDTDFDFNDIVLDVALTDKGAKCVLQAAGATLKIRINGDDNLEVHQMFGVAQSVMVNTKAENKGLSGATRDPIAFDLEGSFKSLDDIKLEVFRQNRWMTLTAPKGDASCKIAVGIDFVWPDERVSLKTMYPDFLKYVRNYEEVESWWKKMTP